MLTWEINMSNIDVESTAAPTVANTTTKDQLLSQAKEAIETSDKSLHDAAEALAIAQELHGVSQAEMARAIGKSEAWVSRLLQWCREGYPGDSPFGPTTKSGRLAHAKDRARSGASKPRKRRESRAEHQPDPDDAEASAEKRKAEYAGQEADSETTTSDKSAALSAELADFLTAVDTLFVKLSWDDQCKAFAYIKKKMAPPC
jgi:hypothetical protein